MEELFIAILSIILIAALVPLYLWKRRQDSRSPNEHEEEPQAPRRETVVRATGSRRMRRRPASGASTSSAPAAQEETVDESDDETDGGEYEAKAPKKKEKKRQERDAQRQADQAARDSPLSVALRRLFTHCHSLVSFVSIFFTGNCDVDSSTERLSKNLECMGINEGYNIPEEIVEKILLLLPVKSLIRFKCVSKSLCTLIEDPTFVANHLHNTKSNISSSTSLFLGFSLFSGFSIVNNYSPAAELPTILNIINSVVDEEDDVDYDSDDDDGFVHCTSECVEWPVTKDMIRNRRLLTMSCQCDGLLCLVSDNDDLFLCNPSIRECRILPPCLLRPHGCDATYGLGYDSKAKDYKIIRISKLFGPKYDPPIAELYSSSSNGWREMDLSTIAKDLRHCLLRITAKVYLKNVYYFLASRYKAKSKLICFDMCEEEFKCISLPSCHNRYGSVTVWNERVVVFPDFYYEGHLRAVVEMWVMDGGNGSWTKHSVIRFGHGVGHPKPLLFWRSHELLVEVESEKTNKRKLISYNIGTTKFRNIPFGNDTDFTFGTDHEEYDSCFGVQNAFPYVKSLISVNQGKGKRPHAISGLK